MSSHDGHREWYSRGYLPHFDHPGLVQGITFRLHDSMPREVLDRWERELEHLDDEARDKERRKRIADYLDAGHGCCWLRQDPIAALVEETLLCFDGRRYRLLAWCVMPNHVHVVIETVHGFVLPDVVHSWKSFSAKAANRLLNRTRTFWQREYFDRFARDAPHVSAMIDYAERNPVKAWLAKNKKEWRWSSAWEGRIAGREE